MLSVLAAVEPDFASYVADVVKQVPWATPLLLWILDLRKQKQVDTKDFKEQLVARDLKIKDLEERIERSNEKIQDDVIPLLTRLSDLIPTLLRKLK
jgi:hypothetical protein